MITQQWLVVLRGGIIRKVVLMGARRDLTRLLETELSAILESNDIVAFSKVVEYEH